MKRLDVCMIVVSKTTMPESDVKRNSGSELCILSDRTSGSRDVGSVAVINGSRKAKLVFLDEVHGRMSDVNMISISLCQRQDREEIVLQLRDMEDIVEPDLSHFHSIDNRMEDD